MPAESHPVLGLLCSDMPEAKSHFPVLKLPNSGAVFTDGVELDAIRRIKF